jgi:hypothetical protein
MKKRGLSTLIAIFLMIHIFQVTATPVVESWGRNGWHFVRNQDLTNEQLAELISSGQIPHDIRQLSLSDNQITDLTPLASLSNLESLILCRNKISDLTPLANLTNLYCLSLSFNQITDVTPLAGLINLGNGPLGGGSLELHDNQITDFTPLVNLVHLRTFLIPHQWYNNAAPPGQIWEVAEAIRRNQDSPSMGFIRTYLRLYPHDSMELAVEILKYIVGLPTGEIFGVVQVDMGFEPSIGDAVEILKFVVGLESMVDDG